jgi:hypothetical protein
VDRLPELRLRLAELAKMRAEYEARGNRGLMVSYIEKMIADIRDEMAQIEFEAD